jgi:hypothetical protein
LQTSEFTRVWARTDRPVLEGQVSRSWMWGPEPLTQPMTESYAEAPGGRRAVQYYDKARMEITRPDGDPTSIWFVTNGLLVNELISGQLQVGDTEFESRQPAEVNVAGDPNDPNGPTYATFASLLDTPPLPLGAPVIQRLDRSGNVSDDPSLAAREVTIGYLDDATNHAVATPFWEFMNSSGLIWNGQAFVEAKLFEHPLFATGRPTTEPYWTTVQVGGTPHDVLIQCFERRVLTYTPENPPGWQVEAGNVGRHYREWRYS